jgi:hypothetical protein
VSRWLNNASGLDGWNLIASELSSFLRERQMNSETMMLHDLALAESYLPHAERMNQLFKRIWEEGVNPVWQQNKGHTDGYVVERSFIRYESVRALLWDWFYLNKGEYNPNEWEWYYGWGIAFPQLGDTWLNADPPLPSRTFLFACFRSNTARQPIPRNGNPEGWSVGFDAEIVNFVCGKPISDFSDDPEQLALNMIEWVKSKSEIIKTKIPEILNHQSTSDILDTHRIHPRLVFR